MIISEEIALKDFPFWGQAARNVALLTEEELRDIDRWINIIYGRCLNKTLVHSIFAYSFDELCEVVGLDVKDIHARSAD